MTTVNRCPNTLHEVEKASKQLGCGKDQFGKDQYMCLPNTEKTSLIEFCHSGIMGIKEKGTCLEVNTKDGAISAISCTAFQSGCPVNHYWNHQFFHYPACQDINMHHQCYVQHPSCPANGDVSNDAADITNQNIHSGGYLYSTIVIIPVIAIFLVVLWIFRKKMKMNRKRDYMTCQTDETPLADVRSGQSICPDTASPDTEKSGLLQDSTSDLSKIKVNNQVKKDNVIGEKATVETSGKKSRCELNTPPVDENDSLQDMKVITGQKVWKIQSVSVKASAQTGMRRRSSFSGRSTGEMYI